MTGSNKARREPDGNSWRLAVYDTSALVLLLWIVHGLDRVLPAELVALLGIRPLAADGLLRVFTAPFIHIDLPHLVSNSLALLPLGVISLRYSRWLAGEAMVTALLVSGAITWLFGGAGTLHCGASGLVFGLIGFLIANGMFRRSIGAFLLAVLVALVYGGALQTVLPLPGVRASGISWPMHLGGLLGGLLTAFHLRRTQR